MEKDNQKQARINKICIFISLICGTLLAFRMAYNPRWFLIRSELTGVFEINDDYPKYPLKHYSYDFGKFYFITDDGNRLAVRNDYMKEIFNPDGGIVWRDKKNLIQSYSMNFKSKVILKGVKYKITDLEAKIRNTEETLSYPESADALFDIETITWLDK